MSPAFLLLSLLLASDAITTPSLVSDLPPPGTKPPAKPVKKAPAKKPASTSAPAKDAKAEQATKPADPPAPPPPAPAPAAPASAADLEEGQLLLEHKCGKCHDLNFALSADLSDAQWNAHMRRMANRPGAAITDDQARKIHEALKVRRAGAADSR